MKLWIKNIAIHRSLHWFLFFFYIFVLRWQVTILWSHWCSLFWPLVDSTHGFQSQGGSIITYTLLLLVHNDPPWSQLWISKPRPVSILHLGMVRLLLEWLPNVTSGITGRGKIRTQDLVAQSPTLYRLNFLRIDSDSSFPNPRQIKHIFYICNVFYFFPFTKWSINILKP